MTTFSEDTEGPLVTVGCTSVVMVVARSRAAVDSISAVVVVAGCNLASLVSMAVVAVSGISMVVVAVSNLMVARVRAVVVVMSLSSSLIASAISLGRPVSIHNSGTLESSVAIIGNSSAPLNFLEAFEVDVL
jgi:hypothetical protein